MKALHSLPDASRESAGILAILFIVAVCGAIVSAAATLHALAGQLDGAAPGVAGIAATAIGHWWLKRRGQYSVLTLAFLFGAGLGLVGGLLGHLVRLL